MGRYPGNTQAAGWAAGRQLSQRQGLSVAESLGLGHRKSQAGGGDFPVKMSMVAPSWHPLLMASESKVAATWTPISPRHMKNGTFGASGQRFSCCLHILNLNEGQVRSRLKMGATRKW
jgi:hypothetical protein